MKCKLICLLLSSVCLFSLMTGCGLKNVVDVTKDIISKDETVKNDSDIISSEVKDNDKIVESKEDIQNSEVLKNKKLYTFLNSFVTYLSNGEITEDILNYFYIPENSYISVSDVEWLLPRIKFDYLVGCDVSGVYIDEAIDTLEDGTNYAINLVTEDKNSVILNVILTNDNEFKITLSDYIVSDYMIKFPTVGEVKIDGVLIPESYLSKKDKFSTTYMFGGILVREHNYTYNNDILGKLGVSLVPVYSKDIQDGRYVLNNIESTEYLPIIQDLWNNIVATSVANNGDISSIRKYFCSTFDETKLATYSTDLYNYLDFKKDTVPVMSDIAWTSESESRVVGDSAIDVCFKYRIKYIDITGSCDMSDGCKVGLYNENGTWVVYGSTDSFLDSEFNSFRENWDSY